MLKSSETQEFEVTINCMLILKPDGSYRLKGLNSRIGSDVKITEEDNDALTCGVAIEVLERLTGLEVGEMMKHLYAVEKI